MLIVLNATLFKNLFNFHVLFCFCHKCSEYCMLSAKCRATKSFRIIRWQHMLTELFWEKKKNENQKHLETLRLWVDELFSFVPFLVVHIPENVFSQCLSGWKICSKLILQNVLYASWIHSSPKCNKKIYMAFKLFQPNFTCILFTKSFCRLHVLWTFFPGFSSFIFFVVVILFRKYESCISCI